ncbi:phytanoyl-CoA dioxygenase family protein [Novosphingobium sp. B 225]|uniref:phytanoyl-CoA dioxygenase family protein n=1 Tax=Novosphingobium sp. B 225 TaxID=1961849 RepID=UPI000B4AC68B|nr:phytanoyl-CoA dioxygenase family protein [Novosphingobium sp. B 225]
MGILRSCLGGSEWVIRTRDDGLITDFVTCGAQLFRGALKPCFAALEAALVALPKDEAGVRLHGIKSLRPLLDSDGCIGAIAANVLGTTARPVRAILFNKSPETNWSLGWHQDRTICVKEKREAPGFGPWTVKSGMIHVAPPFELLTRMVTLRAHLDDVPATNAPLLIAPGSHTFGRIAVREVGEIVRRCGKATCTAEAGDVWLYATPILHASEAALSPASRRVLQVDFAAEALPSGLDWLGV